jgi:hypothetical protein
MIDASMISKANFLIQKSVNDLISNAERVDGFAYWNTSRPKVNAEGKIEHEKGAGLDIYNGNAGILLLLGQLIELHYGDPAVKNLGMELSKWLVQKAEEVPIDRSSFHTGYTGTIFSLLKFADITKSRHLHEQTKLLLLSKIDHLGDETHFCELINGLSGTILGLLLIKQFLPSKRIDKRIEYLSIQIIKRAKFSRRGVCWDDFADRIQPLCGFSHGASGVGHVLLLLANATGNNDFKVLHDLAIRYENSFLSLNDHNWPDFRLDFEDKKSLSDRLGLFRNNEFKALNTPNLMTAWCHGSPGILLQRVFASKNKSQRFYMAHFKTALSHLLATLPSERNISLCHGVSGNTLCAFAASSRQGKLKVVNQYLETIKAFYEDSSTFRMGDNSQGNLNDHGLFLGIGGITFTLLSLTKKNVFNLLIPTSNVRVAGNFATSKSLHTTMSRYLPVKIAGGVFKIDMSYLKRVFYSTKSINHRNKNVQGYLRLNQKIIKLRTERLFGTNFLYLKEMVLSQNGNFPWTEIKGKIQFVLYPNVYLIQSDFSVLTGRVSKTTMYNYVIEERRNDFILLQLPFSHFNALRSIKRERKLSAKMHAILMTLSKFNLFTFKQFVVIFWPISLTMQFVL